MKLVLLILTSSAFIFGIEILKRKFQLPTDMTRRITHIATATVAGLAPLFVGQKEIIVVSIFFAVVLLYGRRYSIFSAIHPVERKTFGEVYLPLGVALAALVFLPNDLASFQFGVFVMGISDPIAGLIGERFGKHHLAILNNKKSLEGSLAFFINTLILTFLFTTTFNYQLILIPAILMLVESLFVYGLDNLVLPIVGAYLLRLLIS